MSTNPETGPLGQAAQAALRAPSIFNTQPWRWQVTGDVLELHLDPQRQLPVVDPDGRLATLSCGIALHHALTALAAAGHTSAVQRLPEPHRPDLLARVQVTGRHAPDPTDIRRHQAILTRHTDRRLFRDEPVPGESLDLLRDTAEAHGGHLHPLTGDERLVLAAAASRAAQIEEDDPGYRGELDAWTHRPAGSGDGVPADTTTPATARTVRVRDFSLTGEGGLEPGTGHDTSASYAILSGDGDNPQSWLRGGEALSAVLLAAVHEGLSVSPMSDVAEVGATREVLRGALHGIGYPYLALRIGTLRIGVSEPTSGVPATPRRPASDVIDVNG
jgi:nitroreductase